MEHFWKVKAFSDAPEFGRCYGRPLRAALPPEIDPRVVLFGDGPCAEHLEDRHPPDPRAQRSGLGLEEGGAVVGRINGWKGSRAFLAGTFAEARFREAAYRAARRTPRASGAGEHACAVANVLTGAASSDAIRESLKP
jgi:hypothetical protein